MRYQKIPRTDLNVSALCLGLANIGVKNTEEEGMALLDAFLDAGGNFIDTARVYSNWVPGELNRSERIIGDWLTDRGVRDRVVVATKGGHFDLADRIPRLSRQEMEIDLQGSLEKLQTDVIDLYYLHRDDISRPVEEILDQLHTFQQAGHIRYYACSNWTVARMQAAHAYAQRAGYTGFVANQMRWSLASFHGKPPSDDTMCSMDRETYDFHVETDMAAIPYNSQAGGFFSKWLDDPRAVQKSGAFTPANEKLCEYLKGIATALNVPISHVVLAYFWKKPFVSIPIVGCRNEAQLQDSVDAVQCELTEAMMQDIQTLTLV